MNLDDDESPFPPLTREEETQGCVRPTWKLLAITFWIIAGVLALSAASHERRAHVRAIAIHKLPECVNRPFLYDPQDVMTSPAPQRKLP